MPSPRHAALMQLLAHLGEQEDDNFKKHSPKFSAMVVDKSHETDPDENSDLLDMLPPELLEKLLAAKDGGDMAPGETPADDAKAQAMEKMSEGGLVEGDSLEDEQMKRREEARKTEADRLAADDRTAMGGGEEKPEEDKTQVAKMSKGGAVMGDTRCPGCGNMKSDCTCDKMSEGGLIEGESTNDEQMKRREARRKADEAQNAEDDTYALTTGRNRVRGISKRSPYYGK